MCSVPLYLWERGRGEGSPPQRGMEGEAVPSRSETETEISHAKALRHEEESGTRAELTTEAQRHGDAELEVG